MAAQKQQSISNEPEAELPEIPMGFKIFMGLLGIGAAAIVGVNGITKTKSDWNEPLDYQKIEAMSAEALANNRMILEVKNSAGITVRLNDLSPKERSLTIQNAAQTYESGHSGGFGAISKRPRYSDTVTIAVSDAKNGDICSFKVDPGRFEGSLKNEPAQIMTVDLAIKYADALGRTCNLSSEKVEAVKVNLISTLQTPPVKPLTSAVLPEGRSVSTQAITASVPAR